MHSHTNGIKISFSSFLSSRTHLPTSHGSTEKLELISGAINDIYVPLVDKYFPRANVYLGDGGINLKYFIAEYCNPTKSMS